MGRAGWRPTPTATPGVHRGDSRANETEWKLLKDKVAEKYYSWDSTAFPDGEYRLRITASDAPGNPPAEALTARLESDPFIIDNTPPEITGLAASRNGRETAGPLARRRRAEQRRPRPNTRWMAAIGPWRRR